MKIHKFLFLLLDLLLLSQYTYAGPSSFKFTFHNTDPDKTVYIWMSGYPRGGATTDARGQPIPYRGKSKPIFIAQDPGQDSKNGITAQWVIQVKDKNNKTFCAVEFVYKVRKNVTKFFSRYSWRTNKKITFSYVDDHWNQSIQFKQYQNNHICLHRNVSWQHMPKPEDKPKHGTRFYRISIYLDELHTIYYLR